MNTKLHKPWIHYVSNPFHFISFSNTAFDLIVLQLLTMLTLALIACFTESTGSDTCTVTDIHEKYNPQTT